MMSLVTAKANLSRFRSHAKVSYPLIRTGLKTCCRRSYLGGTCHSGDLPLHCAYECDAGMVNSSLPNVVHVVAVACGE